MVYAHDYDDDDDDVSCWSSTTIDDFDEIPKIHTHIQQFKYVFSNWFLFFFEMNSINDVRYLKNIHKSLYIFLEKVYSLPKQHKKNSCFLKGWQVENIFFFIEISIQSFKNQKIKSWHLS